MTKQDYDEMVQTMKQYKQLNEYAMELEYAINQIETHNNLHGIQIDIGTDIRYFPHAPKKYKEQLKQDILVSLDNTLAAVKQEMEAL